MSEDTLQQADITLANQITGLIEVRKSKLSRLESVYVRGRSNVEKMRSQVKTAKRNQDEFKQIVRDQIQALSDTYLSGGYSPMEIQKWFAKEKYLKAQVIQGRAEVIQQEATLRQLKKANQEEKQAYQRAMIGVEKMEIMQAELLNGTA